MSVQVKRRRDTAANIAAANFAPAQGELVVDTTNNRVLVGDGSTVGGWPAAKLSEVVLNNATLNTVAKGANGSTFQFGIIEAVSPALSGASYTFTNIIPLNATVFSVGSYVVTPLAGSTSYSCGDVAGGGDGTASATRFGGALSQGAGSSNAGLISPTAFNNSYNPTSVILTANGGNFTAGVIRISIHYAFCTASTS